MQAAPVIAGVILVGLMSLTGFQIVPESAISGSRSDADIQSDQRSQGPQIRVTDRSTPAPVVAGIRDEVTASSITSVQIKTAQNVEASTATLRAEVTVGEDPLGAAFFIYSYNETSMERSLVGSDSYVELLENKRTNVGVKRVSSSVRRDGSVSTKVGGLAPDTRYIARLCVESQNDLLCTRPTRFTTAAGATKAGDVDLPTIRINNEDFVAADEVTINAIVDMRDTEDGRVYVVYGESRNLVSEALDQEYGDIEEDDELIQKKRIAANVRGRVSVTETLDDLKDETDHYYIICVSYDGLKDGFICSRLQSFTTHDDDFGQTPTVRTNSVAISGVTVRLSGEVRMSPFRNGQVFFVYGTDASRIGRLGGEGSMNRITQSGDRLQRVLVDADLDGSDEYNVVARDLLPETDYAVRMCVEYENQNERYREVDFIECGEITSFITGN